MTTTASYDATKRLCWTAAGTATGPCASAPAGATTYGYDGNGNRTSQSENGGTTTCGYDAADHLTTVSGPTTASYTYDGDGYRVGKTANGTSTRYTWDRLGTVLTAGGAEYVAAAWAAGFLWPRVPGRPGRDSPGSAGQGRRSRPA